MMPDKSIAASVAKTAAIVPVSVVGMIIFGIPLSDWAYIAAIASGFVAVIAYCVKMWRDIQIGLSAKRNTLNIEEDA